MLPEQIARFLELEDFKRLSSKLEDAMSSDYWYSSEKTKIMHAIAEIIELSYKKGRTDQLYYHGGPSISIYEKPE